MVDKLKSKHHCTTPQAVAVVVEVANGLFYCSWKYHDEDKDIIDLDTAPHSKNIREAGKASTILAPASIVDEIMDSETAVVSYHDDGSKKQGIGVYSVQGITINDNFKLFTSVI